MKRIVTLGIIAFFATLFGCNDTTVPKSEVRFESASEATRNEDRSISLRLSQQKAAADEAFARERLRELRQQSVDALRTISIRWNEVLDEAFRTLRSDIAGVIKKLQIIKSETELVEVDDCTSVARASLALSMDTTIDALSLFQKETGTGVEASRLKLQLGAELLDAARREINACVIK